MNSKIRIRVTGKNINRFVMRLIQSKIEIYDLENVSSREVNVLIKENDYSSLKKIKSIYQTKVISYEGFASFKNSININKYLIIIMMVGVMFVFLLSNIIFSVKVIHTDKDIQSLILGELNDYGIKVHNFKKSPKRVEQIKNKILKKYKDKIEWLEIENYGTSYIVRVEERIIPDNPEVIPPRDVVAKKSAVILKITSTSGSVQKLVGNYVKAGDVIVSGTIKLNEEVKNTVPAKATVYGEVWYNVTTEYPYIYSEKQYTGNVKKGLLYNFLDNHILMFGKSYKDSKITDKFKISSTFLPIFLSFSQMREVVNIEKIYTEEEALQMAIQRSHKEIEGKLKKNEYIINETPLKVEYKDNTIVVNMFYNVCEDITEYRNIDTPPQ